MAKPASLTCAGERAPTPARCSAASGSSPTASAATPRARCAGIPTRRYHGLLIAALPAPLGRTMMLNHLSEQLAPAPTARASSSAARSAPAAALELARRRATSREFRLEDGLAGVALRDRRHVSRSAC